MSERPTRLDKTEASAGKTGLGVRYVLTAGMVPGSHGISFHPQWESKPESEMAETALAGC